MLKIIIKPFDALTKQELYSILQLRSAVFVLEQHCIYQDVDGKDQKAFHLMGYKDDVLVAYTRIFKPDDYFKEASIGRVLVKKSFRQHRYGYDIMNASVAFIRNDLKQSTIKISAQAYLRTFYSNVGFNEVDETYLEDGIPHIAMIASF